MNNDATPGGHVQTVLLDPITATRDEAVFRIARSGDAVLRGAVFLHVGLTGTVAAPVYPANPASGSNQFPSFQPNNGAYSLISEVQIQDPQGRTLYHCRNAGRYAALELLRQSASTSLDIECERSFVRRSFKPQLDGTFLSGSNDFQVITGNTLTTPRACLDLRRVVNMFKPGSTTTSDGAVGGGIPLASTGDLTLTIRWQNQLTAIVQNSAMITNEAIDRPQLEFQYHRADAVSAAMATSTIAFEEPVSSSNLLLLGDLDASLPMGGGGMRVSRLLVAPVAQADSANPWAKTLGPATTYNLVANGVPLYPQPLNSAGVLAETYAAFQPQNMPAGSYAAVAGALVAAASANDSWVGFPLCPLPALPGSAQNSTALDSSGLYLQVRRPAAAAADMTCYAWLMRPKVIQATPAGIQVIGL